MYNLVITGKESDTHAEKNYQSRKTSPWDGAPSMTATQSFLSEQFKDTYHEKHPSLKVSGESDLINSFLPESCPYCGMTHIVKRGMTSNGIQRYKCFGCGKTFTPVTGTIFEGHKVSITAWTEYLLNLIRYVSMDAGSWNNRNAFTTSRYWLEKVFLILEDREAHTMLSGRIWMIEMLYPFNDKPGTKINVSQQFCIGLACTSSHVLCVIEGTGRPSKTKSWKAFQGHIAPGSTLIHDNNTVHSMLVTKLGLKEKLFDPKTLKGMASKDNPMNRVNKVQSRLMAFLNAHSGINSENLNNYLNLFTFTMNQPKGYLEKVDELLNLSFKTHRTLRYRDFYG